MRRFGVLRAHITAEPVYPTCWVGCVVDVGSRMWLQIFNEVEQTVSERCMHAEVVRKDIDKLKGLRGWRRVYSSDKCGLSERSNWIRIGLLEYCASVDMQSALCITIGSTHHPLLLSHNSL